MTVVSYEHKVILLKTRKTAGTSVELWLSSIAGPRDVVTALDPGDEHLREGLGGLVQNCEIPRGRYRPADFLREVTGGRRIFVSHMPAHEVRTFVGRRVWDSFLKVTLERDAFERATSMYRFKTRNLVDPPGVVEFLRRFPAYKLANAPIYTIDGQMVADVVIDHTHLAEDVVALQRYLGVDESPLPRAKSYEPRVRDDCALLGPEGVRMVESVCKDDVALMFPEKRARLLQR